MRSALVPVLILVLAAAGRAEDPPAKAPPTFAGRSLDAWVADLKDPNPLVREEALEVVARLGADARPAADAVRKLLDDPLLTTRLRASLALWKIERKVEAALPALAAAARDPNQTTRLLVLDALEEVGPEAKDAARVLIEFLGDADFTLRNRAVTTLARLGPDALPALLAALQRDNPEIVRQALSMIGTLGPHVAGDPKVAPAVRAKLKEKTPALRVLAARTLYFVNRDADAALPVLLDALKESATAVRYEALQVLALIRPLPKAAVAGLEDALEDRDLLTRVLAAEMLHNHDGRTKPLLPVLLPAVGDPANFMARSHARAAL